VHIFAKKMLEYKKRFGHIRGGFETQDKCKCKGKDIEAL